MTATRLVLTNDFHQTEAHVRMTRDEMEQIEYDVMCGSADAAAQAKRRIRRVWKQLCGIKECTCGNMWGERGHSPY